MGIFDSIGKALKGVGGFLFDDPSKQAFKANSKNEKYIKGIYESLTGQLGGEFEVARNATARSNDLIHQGVAKSQAQIGGFGNASRMQARNIGQQALGAGQQDLVSRGLHSSSLTGNLRQGVAGNTMQAYAAIDAAVAEMQSAAIMQGAEMEAQGQLNLANLATSQTQMKNSLGAQFAATLGGIQHVGGPSLFQQLLIAGAQGAGKAAGAGA
jgi:hypothetical protein